MTKVLGAEEASGKPTIVPWLPEARSMAAQCWCTPETSSIEIDSRLAEAIAWKIAAWMDTGAFHARNESYWRDRTEKAEAKIDKPEWWLESLNRRVAVEQMMLDVARGKRPMPTPQELREWALRLGTLDEWPKAPKPSNA